VPDEFVFLRSRPRLLVSALLSLTFPAAVIGYAVALHASGTRLLALAAWFGLMTALSAPGLVVALFGPSPVLTVDGLRVRRHPWRPRLVLVPWSETLMLWIEYFGRRAFLSVLPPDPSRNRPYRIFLSPPSASPTELADAIRTLSRGTVELSHRPPDRTSSPFDDGDRPFRRRTYRTGRAAKTPIWVYASLAAVLAVTVPFLMDRPQPWRQPWWPGVNAAAVAPDPCHAISADVSRDLFASAAGRSTVDRGDHRACRIEGNLAEMVVEYSVFNPAFGSAEEAAADHMDQAVYRTGRFSPEPVRELGDEAWIAGNPQGTTTLIDRGQALAVVRRANVVLEVIYRGESEPDVARAAVLDTARRGIAAVETW
jgi:hypothetical protein